MAEFGAKDIQKLRLDAGVGMMDAKQALTDADGDMEKAFELLRERGQAKMAKRADREANQGTIGSYIHIQNDRPVMGVLVELACETDFVAKSQEFKQAADDIAMHVSWGRPTWVTREEVDEETLAKEREIIQRQAV
ncbi:MAG TPA: elongation factor Ts, partial [Acidimicrobiia bacterium]|nr:elongation factor Ts [Acidimicrobiia bacterium]